MRPKTSSSSATREHTGSPTFTPETWKKSSPALWPFTAVGLLSLRWVSTHHRHLSSIDCLMVRTACLVCFISTVNSHSKKERKGKKPIKIGASRGHITNLKQSIRILFWYVWYSPTKATLSFFYTSDFIGRVCLNLACSSGQNLFFSNTG